MKKYVGTLVFSLSLLTALPLAAHADDSTKDTEANIELTQDEDNKDVTLDAVPGVNFGSHVNSKETKTYTAESVSGNVQVTNPGSSDGWAVQAKRTAFTGSNTSMKGEKITFANGTVAATDTGNASKTPTTQDFEITTENSNILVATKGEGVGEFTMTHDKGDVSLYVPAGNVADNYTSTITWSLTNTPDTK